MVDWYNALLLVSYSAIFYFVIGARNLGKTWAFKIRAVKRFQKKGYKTVWVRRFKNEAKKSYSNGKFYPTKLLKILGLNENNFKWVGNRGYIKRKGTKVFTCFIEVIALTQWANMRSADDPKIRDIIFDEFTTTPDKYKMYHGNECENFIDLFVSCKREHKLNAFFLGNKESVINPYFSYFNITPPEEKFNGIRAYKKGSIIIQVKDDLPKEIEKSYEGKFNAALENTPYGNYLTKGAQKTNSKEFIKRKPKQAQLYAQFDFGNPFQVYVFQNNYFVKSGIDKNKRVFVDIPKRKYKNEYILQHTKGELFNGIINAYKYNLLWYDSQISFEIFTGAKKYLHLK